MASRDSSRARTRSRAAEMAAVIAAIDPLEAQTEAFLRTRKDGTLWYRARRRNHVPAAPRHPFAGAPRVSRSIAFSSTSCAT